MLLRNENGTFKFGLNNQNSLLNWHMAPKGEEEDDEDKDKKRR